MLYRNKLFLAVILVTGGVLTCTASAAPTIKKIGGTTDNSTQGTMDKGTLTKLSTAQRTPSIRALGLSAQPTATNTVSSASQSAGNGGSMRLSGVHNNIFSGFASKLSSNSGTSTGGNSGSITSNLTQRVTDLEAAMVTKQEILESGNGIDINGNTIGLSDEIASLPERLESVEKDIDDLNDQIKDINLSDDYYTIDEVQQNYYDKETVDQMISQLSSMNVVNQFDPGFLHTEPKAQP